MRDSQGQGYRRTSSLLFLSLVCEDLRFLASQRAKAFPTPGCQQPQGGTHSSGHRGVVISAQPLLRRVGLTALQLSRGECGFWSELGIPSCSDGSFFRALARGTSVHPSLHTVQ